MLPELVKATAASSTGVQTSDLKVSNRSFNLLLLEIIVGGSGHVRADFFAHKLNLTFRSRVNGMQRDFPYMSDVRIGDLQVQSDMLAGFSETQEGDDGTRYAFFVPAGRVVLKGDDSIEGNLQLPGDATATYAYRLSTVDLKAGPEVLLTYESIVGSGDLVHRKNVKTILFQPAVGTTPAGESIMVQDGFKSVTGLDYEVVALGNAIGSVEVLTQAGQMYGDRSGYTQDVSFKVPSGDYGLIQAREFDVDRFRARIEDESQMVEATWEQIVNQDPGKAAILEAEGARG